MASVITMPRYGATMEEGTIAAWRVSEGDAVSKGDVLGEIEIEKLSNELLAEEDGVVLKLLAAAGETLKCGEPILMLGEAGETLAAPLAEPAGEGRAAEAAAAPALGAPQSGGARASAPAAAGAHSEQAQATPKALQLARELGVDYHTLRGTGRFGMVTREDVRAAASRGAAPAAGPAAPPAEPARRPMSQMQRQIAKAMDESLRATAQTTIAMDLDATALVRAYQAHKADFARRGEKLTYTAMLVKIAALALESHPALRTVIDGGELVTRNEINIGVAVDVAGGLVVPNIKDAARKDIHRIAVELADLAARAAKNALAWDDVTGGTFTISNLGMFGIKYFTPVLNPGESALLGVGAIQEVPVVRDGGIYVRPVLNLSLTHDHRVVNGAPAARFLQAVQQLADGCETIF